jgi:hypothetical protein
MVSAAAKAPLAGLVAPALRGPHVRWSLGAAALDTASAGWRGHADADVLEPLGLGVLSLEDCASALGTQPSVQTCTWSSRSA